MDHTAARKRPSSARFHKYLPYLAHQVAYQSIEVKSGAQVSRFHAYIHPYRNGISGHLILGRGLLICHQNRAEAQTKDAAMWAWEPLTAKARKGQPQPIEQRTEKIWIVSGQPVQAASKEGHQKDKQGYREVVRLP
jgi:hypothetical protein